MEIYFSWACVWVLCIYFVNASAKQSDQYNELQWKYHDVLTDRKELKQRLDASLKCEKILSSQVEAYEREIQRLRDLDSRTSARTKIENEKGSVS